MYLTSSLKISTKHLKNNYAMGCITSQEERKNSWLIGKLWEPWGSVAFKSLTSKSDSQLISLYNITPGSNTMVTRLKEMITN